jgi:hypothetical protein
MCGVCMFSNFISCGRRMVRTPSLSTRTEEAGKNSHTHRARPGASREGGQGYCGTCRGTGTSVLEVKRRADSYGTAREG